MGIKRCWAVFVECTQCMPMSLRPRQKNTWQYCISIVTMVHVILMRETYRLFHMLGGDSAISPQPDATNFGSFCECTNGHPKKKNNESLWEAWGLPAFSRISMCILMGCLLESYFIKSFCQRSKTGCDTMEIHQACGE